MNLYCEDQSRVHVVRDYSGLCSEFSGNIGECNEYLGNGFVAKGCQSLVLDSETGELVKEASGRVGKRKGEGVTEVKSATALKSHSQAEKRRRERINTHLAALRVLVPSNEKMDKAALLAEVINQVKQLKKTAKQASDSFFVPMDSDEVKVEENDEDDAVEGTNSFRASICCEYRTGLLSDIRRSLDSLQVTLVRSEISTLESRVKNVFFFTASVGDTAGNAAVARARLVSSVHQALSSIMEKAAALAEYSPRTLMLPSKRQRVSYFESLCSSS